MISPRWIAKSESAKIIVKGRHILQHPKLNKGEFGKNGQNGKNGENGKHGLFFYGYGLFFENLKNLQIDVSGGAGQDGQDGADGADGRNYDLFSDMNIADNGWNGGNGGFGGEGGYPGNAYVFQKNKLFFSYKKLEKIGERGKNGQGGRGGVGGRLDYLFLKSKFGKKGKDGIAGIYPPSIWEKEEPEPFGNDSDTFIKKTKEIFKCLADLLKKVAMDVKALSLYEHYLFDNITT